MALESHHAHTRFGRQLRRTNAPLLHLLEQLVRNLPLPAGTKPAWVLDVTQLEPLSFK